MISAANEPVQDEWFVTLTIKVSTKISFDMRGREDTTITHSDVIDNAIGSLEPDFFDRLNGNGFNVAYPIEGEVTDA